MSKTLPDLLGLTPRPWTNVDTTPYEGRALERAIRENPKLVDQLIDPALSLKGVEFELMRYAWVAVMDVRPQQLEALLEKCWADKIDLDDVIKPCDGFDLDALFPWTELVCGKYQNPTRVLGEWLHGMIESRLHDFFGDPQYKAPDTAWFKVMLDALHRVALSQEIQAVLDEALGRVVDESMVPDKHAMAEVLGLLVGAGANPNQARTATYEDPRDYDHTIELHHSTLLHQAVHARKSEVAWWLVELGAEWRAVTEDPVIGQAALEILKDHPKIRRDQLMTHTGHEMARNPHKTKL